MIAGISILHFQKFINFWSKMCDAETVSQSFVAAMMKILTQHDHQKYGSYRRI